MLVVIMGVLSRVLGRDITSSNPPPIVSEKTIKLLIFGK